MKNVSLIVGLAFFTGLTFYALEGNAQMRSGMMGQGMLEGGMMGNGITGGSQMGRGGGSGTGNPGFGTQYGPPNGLQSPQPQKQLAEKDAKEVLENYLKSTRNPNLKLGRVEDKGNAFEAEILTKNNSLVDRILVDKNNGGMRSAY